MHIAKNIATIGSIFINKVKSDNIHIIASLESDWKKALEFFLFHAFMRGRSDKLSIAYKNHTFILLNTYLDNSLEKINGDVNNLTKEISNFKVRRDIKANSNSLSNKYFFTDFQSNDFIQLFSKKNEVNQKFLVGNDKDIIMVGEVLKLILNDKVISNYYNLNIYNFTVGLLLEDQVTTLYKKINSIRFIKDKLASFYLRNVIKLANLNRLESSIEYFLPIDRWINDICTQLAIFNIDDSLKVKKNKMISYCRASNIDVIEFNQGAWLIGYSSYPLLIEILRKQILPDELDLNLVEIFRYLNE